MLKQLHKNLAAVLVIAAMSVAPALAQSPSGGMLNWLSGHVSVSTTSPSGAGLNLSMAPPKDGTARPSFSAASVSDFPFGRTPFTLDAQYGYDANFPKASLAMSNPLNSNEAWKALVGYQWGSLNLKAGVNQFNPAASPTYDVTRSGVGLNLLGGAEFDGVYTFSSALRLTAGGQYYDGRANSGQQSILGVGDHMNSANVGVSYGISRQSSLELGYEWVQWDLNNGTGTLNAPGKPSEQYITLGLGQDLSKHAAFKLLYQVVDYKDNGTGFYNSSNVANNEGQTVIGQATLKF